MTTITCDTTPAGDGNIHAVIFHPIGLPAWSDPWSSVDIGTVLDLIDQDTGATTTGTLASFEVSTSVGDAQHGSRGLPAVRIELTITPG